MIIARSSCRPVLVGILLGVLVFWVDMLAANAQPSSEEETGTSQQEIRGGAVIPGFTGVVDFSFPVPETGAGRQQSCTGALIAPTAILTAAHCLDRINNLGVTDANGNLIRQSGTLAFSIRYHHPSGQPIPFAVSGMWFVLPNYSGNLSWPGIANRDIAAIVLPRRFPSTNHRDYLRLYDDTIEKLQYENGEDRWLDLYGAGRFKYNPNSPNDNLLRTGRFEVENVEANHIIIDNQDNLNTCLGDSGGPLVFTARTKADGAAIPLIAGVLSLQQTGDIEPNTCAENDPPRDNSALSRTNWDKLSVLMRAAGIECTRFRIADADYRRCFTIPFINDAPEGLNRDDAVALTVSSIF